MAAVRFDYLADVTVSDGYLERKKTELGKGLCVRSLCTSVLVRTLINA